MRTRAIWIVVVLVLGEHPDAECRIYSVPTCLTSATTSYLRYGFAETLILDRVG